MDSWDFVGKNGKKPKRKKKTPKTPTTPTTAVKSPIDPKHRGDKKRRKLSFEDIINSTKKKRI